MEIVDEEHEVRKYRIKTSESLAAVEAKIVRAVTGTPIVIRLGIHFYIQANIRSRFCHASLEDGFPLFQQTYQVPLHQSASKMQLHEMKRSFLLRFSLALAIRCSVLEWSNLPQRDCHQVELANLVKLTVN